MLHDERHAEFDPIGKVMDLGRLVIEKLKLKASGVAYTILRNGWYSENYTGFVSSALSAALAMAGFPGRRAWIMRKPWSRCSSVKDMRAKPS
jgi:hypothetical protein